MNTNGGSVNYAAPRVAPFTPSSKQKLLLLYHEYSLQSSSDPVINNINRAWGQNTFAFEGQMTVEDRRFLMLHEYLKNATAQEAAMRMNEVWGQGTANKATVAKRFLKFASGDYDLNRA